MLRTKSAWYAIGMEMRDFVVRNRSGKRINCTLRVPEGAVRGTVILLHGLAGWKDQSTLLVMAAAAVAAGYRAVSFDGADCLRGPDASYRESTTTGFISDTEDVIRYVQEQEWGKGPFILAGHSLGALCAVRYARMHPEFASKLLLVAPAISAYKDRSKDLAKRVRYMLTHLKRLQAKQRETGEKFILPIYPAWIMDYFKYDIRKDAPCVTKPVCMISAGDDLIVSGPKEHEVLAKLFPDVSHMVIEGASHTFSEHEAALAATIRQWLTS